MEMTSFLAGERWSDRPACTHPVIAALARTVNDLLSDRARQSLALLVPLAVGTSDPDERLSAELSLVALEHVRARLVRPSLAVEAASLTAEVVLGRGTLETLGPEYDEDAADLVYLVRPSLRRYARRGAPAAVSNAAKALYRASSSRDEDLTLLLRTLLEHPLVTALRDRSSVPDRSWSPRPSLAH